MIIARMMKNNELIFNLQSSWKRRFVTIELLKTCGPPYPPKYRLAKIEQPK